VVRPRDAKPREAKPDDAKPRGPAKKRD
jgi:hypothetical protein